MEKVIIQIDPIECNRIEGLFNEVESLKSLIAFMMSNDNQYSVDDCKLNNLCNTYSSKFREYNTILSYVSKKYLPEDFSELYNYKIEFSNSTIEYTEVL